MADTPRCVNIDWLELYCYEPITPRDPQYYEARGLSVRIREYGTRHWGQVFTILDEVGEDFIEVRRAPRKTVNGKHAIYPDNACNLRLVNRYCYFDTAMWLMNDFIEKHGYMIRRIYRLDICLDFLKFDSGDDPADVARRIIRHKYAKVYQSERTAHGRDYWNGCEDNSLSWGRKGSMIVTRFYNKSLELATVHDKPWIKQAWHRCGLIADPVAPIIVGKDGRVVGDAVWRVEFQINSSARGWFVDDSQDKPEYVPHTIEAYWNKSLLLQAFANLSRHYFDFRIYEPAKKKYDCKRKELFDIKTEDETYSLKNTLAKRAYDKTMSQQLKWLMQIRGGVYEPDDVAACERLIATIKERERRQEGFEIY